MMSTAVALEPQTDSLADLVERLGGIPLARIRLHPAPGTATEQDVLATDNGRQALCELVEGVLVEKTMGFYEARLAAMLIQLLGAFAEERNLGVVAGADGMMRIARGLVRIPDVSFVSWDRLPGRKLPRAPIPQLAPDLAVEVLSAGNTDAEMNRKLREYFDAGVRLVWYLDPEARQVRVYGGPEHLTVVDEDGTLEGADVLPGFSLPVREWFERAGTVAEE